MIETLIQGPWGYAILKDDALYIPAIMGNMNEILKGLYGITKQRKMIFTAIMFPDKFRPHLKNIKREWDEYVPEFEDYSHCIEIEYEG